jgi:hypothetical protein
VLRADGQLLYYKPNKANEYSRDESGPNPPRGIIFSYSDVYTGDSSNVPLEWPRDAPSSCRFSLPTPDRTYHIYCDTNSDAEQWITALRWALHRREAPAGQ